MKKHLILLYCLFFIAKSNAQYVNIPDVNFRNFLIGKYPSCFNGAKQMDTTRSLIVNENSLDIGNKNIASLNEIRYFKN